MRILHIAADAPDLRIWTPLFQRVLSDIGSFQLQTQGCRESSEELARRIRECDVLITGWGSIRCPDAIASDPGELRYICNVTGETAPYVSEEVMECGVQVSNWGDDPAQRVAEGAMTLLLATLKDLHDQILTVRRGAWQMNMDCRGGSIENEAVGLYGFGTTGSRFAKLIQPFRPRLRVYDPYTSELPENVLRCESLEELFNEVRIVSIHAALTPETRNSVNARLLSLLPDRGVIINTARGAIIDQAALFAELESGRLRAGLDVLDDGDILPTDHPARTWPNLILTTHRVEYGWPPFWKDNTRLSSMQKTVIENIRRFASGKEPRFLFDSKRFARTT